MKKNILKITFLGVFAAIAIVLSYIELLLPPIWSAVPGIKVGLPNIIIVFLLYKFSFKAAAIVSFLRLFAMALLFGNAVTFVYSFAGATLSLAIMWVLNRTHLFSQIGVSIAGGVSHNIAQLIVAVLLLKTKEIGLYAPVLAVTGTVAGIFVGFTGILLLRYTKNIKLDL